METLSKSTIASLIFALLASLAFSGCESSGSAPSNTHEMGGPGKPRMDNSIMPGRN